MLTRLRFRKDVRLYIRCLSDKPSDTDVKAPENKSEKDDVASKKTLSNTEKIQSLLKSMLLETKVKEAEYKEKFAVAPDVIRKPKKTPDVISVKTEQIEERLTDAAVNVAQAIGGDVKQTEAELLSKVLGKINQTSTSLSDLILGMKVDRTKEKEDREVLETRGQQVKRHMSNAQRSRGQEQSQYAPRQNRTQSYQARPDSQQRERVPRSVTQPSTIDIFAGAPLGIFKNKEANFGTKLDTWEALKQRELTLATVQRPTNYFEKMAVWTQQGKVWKFPINNEQGYEEEAKVHFSEHIFLDAHLEGWCPKKGPVRHFMELVCAGLSKNPFYTVQEKKDHIMWYKEYFESKQSVLTEVGAWDVKDSKDEASV